MSVERLLALPLPRLIIGLLWLALIVIFGWRMHHRGASKSSDRIGAAATNDACPSPSVLRGRSHYSALRDMVVNHRISEPDLEWTDVAGKKLSEVEFANRYLTCPVNLGDPVVAGEVRDTPIVQPSGGKLVYVLPATEPGNEVTDLDVGSVLDVFEGNTPLLRKVSVLAIQCSDSTTAHCSILLDLTPPEGNLLLRADAGKLYIVRLHS